MTNRQSHARGFAPLIVASVAIALSLPAHAGAAVKPPEGAAKPTPGSGIGTAAAMNNPRCNTSEPRYGVYGRFNGGGAATMGTGGICVKPWKQGDDNGGATYRGVTADSIRIVAVVPNEQQITVQAQQGGTPPTDRVTGERGSYRDAVYDYFLPYAKGYEQWGRDLEIVFIESSGSDEVAQRSDVVKVMAEKPFAVLDISPVGLDFLEAEVAKSKTPVFGYATTTKKALQQAPYRWGQTDAQASAINVAEFLGKQIVGQPAEHAGDPELQKQKRKFGVIYNPETIDIAQFERYFKKFGGTVAVMEAYESNGSTIGDATLAQQYAPVAVAKMKEQGVNNVILFSDVAMTGQVTKEATKIGFHPEWTITGAVYQDLSILSRGTYDQDQWSHAFGISNLSPCSPPACPLGAPQPPPSTNVLDWYWGLKQATSSVTVPSFIGWVLAGIHTAGPNLTPQTFKQGLFSIPATGGAASGYPVGFMMGYGRTAGLPYDEYMQLGLDFAPVWYDKDSTSQSQVTGTVDKGTTWYVDGAKRYRGGEWPTKRFAFFDKASSVSHFDTRQTPEPTHIGVCAGCPSDTGRGGDWKVPSSSGFTIPAGGAEPTTAS